MSTLQSLIDDAVALASPDETLHGGRMWRSVGGRACPIGWDHCSQPVFEDVRTGETDYGEPGGPGHADCVKNCRERMLPPPPEDDDPNRPTEEAARAAIEAWLDQAAPGYPDYSLCEDGDDGWAFWIAPNDTTSYLHADLRVEWYGTGWPENRHYDGNTGEWTDKP